MMHADAELEVGRVEQRHLREPLQSVQRDRRLERLAADDGAIGWVEQHGRYRLGAAEHEEAADVRLRHATGEPAERLGVVWQVRGLERRDEHLANLLVDRHRRQRLLDPSRRHGVARLGLRLCRHGDDRGD